MTRTGMLHGQHPAVQRRRRAVSISAAVVAAAIGVSACQSSTPQAQAVSGGEQPSALASPTAEQAELTVSPADGATSVRPDATVTVTATHGTITDVSMTSAAGDRIDGLVDPTGTTWTATGSLLPKTSYTVKAKGSNTAGTTTSVTTHLTTLAPKDVANYGLVPSGSGQVGVGMPVVVQFVSPVDDDKKAAVQKRVSVKAVPATAGHWGWLDSRQLIWRPNHYWKSGTTVTVTADIGGIETRKGLWTTHDDTNTFHIGPAMISTVNTKTHRMTVTRNGKTLRVLKVSTGRPGSETETRGGIKVILSRESEHTMDSATVGIPKGDPAYYNIKTQWAMRLTWSGEFLHSAPWSVGSQGSANVSHGCTNLSPSDAKWLFDISSMGDVVKFVGSSRKLEEYNGYTMWNETPAQWAAKSALA